MDDEDFSTTAPPVGDAAGVAVGKVRMIGRARPADDADEGVGTRRMQATWSNRPLLVQSDDYRLLLLPLHIDDGQIWKSPDGPVVEEWKRRCQCGSLRLASMLFV